MRPDAAAVSFHYLFCNEEPVARGIGIYIFCMFAPPAFGKKFLHIVFCNADSRGGPGEPDSAVCLFERKLDVSHGGVAERVFEQIAEHVPLKLFFISREDARIVYQSHERESLALYSWSELFRYPTGCGGEVKWFFIKSHRAARGVGIAEHGHNSIHAFFRIGERRVRHRIERRGDGAVVALDDGRERRFAFGEVAFYLVAEEMQELALLARGLFELAVAVVLFENDCRDVFSVGNADDFCGRSFLAPLYRERAVIEERFEKSAEMHRCAANV